MRPHVKSILLVGAAFAGSNPVLAHQSDQDSVVVSRDEVEAAEGEILVTARKREERLIDIPATIDAFSSDQLVKSGNYSLEDLQSNLSNFFIASPRPERTAVTMRGLGVPGVGLYIDGVYQANPAAFTLPLFDVDRVEVLKGPQGTLYGRNAYSGAVNYVTRAPSSDLEGEINAEVGSGDTFRGTATIAGPIIGDIVMARISGAFQRRNGFRNFVDGSNADIDDYDAISARVLITPADRVKLDFKYTHVDRNSPAFLYHQAAGLNDHNGKLLIPSRQGVIAGQLTGRRPEGLLTSDAYSARLAYSFDAFDAISVTSYDRIRSSSMTDGDLGPVDVVSALSTFSRDDFSQEIRLQSTSSGTFKWLAGLYYTKGDTNSCATCGNLFGGTLFGGTQQNPLNIFQKSSPVYFEGYAGFADVEYSLSEQVVIGGGIRYDSIDQDYRPINQQRIKQNFHGLQPKLTARYVFNRDAQIYVSATKGFTEGGFNGNIGDPALETFPNQTLWSYEAGFKSAFLDRAGSVSIAFFYIDSPSFNAPALVATPLGFRVITAPVGKIRSYGVEADASYRVSDHFLLEFNGGYNVAEPTELSDNVSPGIGNVGEQIQRAPKWSYRAAATFTRPLSGDISLRLNAAVSGVGPTIFGGETILPGPLDRRDPYHLVDVSVGFDWKNLSMALFAKNLLNERYPTDFLSRSALGQFGGTTAGVTYGEPRYAGVRANIKF